MQGVKSTARGRRPGEPVERPDADLLEGGNAGGNQMGRNQPKGNVAVEAVSPLPERETSDRPKQAETAAAYF
jgi:hypothetical protein